MQILLFMKVLLWIPTDSAGLLKLMKTMVQFQAHVDDVAVWKQRAYEQRISLSELIRRSLASAAPPVLPVVLPPAPAPVVERPLVDPAECLNRLSPGTYCVRCGRVHGVA